MADDRRTNQQVSARSRMYAWYNADSAQDEPDMALYGDGSLSVKGGVRSSGGGVFYPENPSYGDGGARGDGTTDDSTAFTDLVTAVNTAGGGVIELRAGAVYPVSGLNFTTSNVTINGNGATLKQKAALSQRVRFGATGALVDNIVVRDLKIDGASATGGFGLQLWITSRCLVDNVQVAGATALSGYLGIQIRGDSATAGVFIVRGCKVDDCGSHGIQIASDVVGGVVADCQVDNTNVSGVGACIYGQGLGNVITGNTVSNAQNNGIRCSGVRSVVVNNVLKLVDDDGIRLEGDYSVARGNVISEQLGTTCNGIRVRDARYCIVEGNQATGLLTGIKVENEGGQDPDGCIVANNEVWSNSAQGILIQHGDDHHVIGNHVFDNGGVGIQGGAASSSVTDTIVTGNNCHGNTYPVRTFSSSDYWLVVGNIMKTADHATGGITLVGSNNTTDNNIT